MKTILFTQKGQTHKVALDLTEETMAYRFGEIEFSGKKIPVALPKMYWATMDGEGRMNCIMKWGMVPRMLKGVMTAELYQVGSTGKLTF